MKQKVVRRFWSKVAKGEPDECWPWKAGRFRRANGTPSYGAFSLTHREQVRSHRFAFTICNGPIPKGLVVCHSCDNEACCNPAHLWLGSNADNVRDRDAKARTARGERCGGAKLTASMVEKIAADARTQRAVAREFGISKSMVGNIRRGENWRHLGVAVKALS